MNEKEHDKIMETIREEARMLAKNIGVSLETATQMLQNAFSGGITKEEAENMCYGKVDSY